MDRQAGGVMGSRGAGETASELLARRLDGRLAELRRRLEHLETSDRARRKRRSGCARVALVGYTNAGKTSLMNALTEAELSVRDRPFETLDTTSRSLSRYGGDVLLSDTVGFIRDLPQRLYASFETTLAEVAESTLLVVVLDVSNPEHEAHLASTDEVLERLGARGTPSSGRVHTRHERIAYVAQNATNWCLAETLLERLGEPLDNAAALLRAHRFPFALADRPLRELSPGERLRAALLCAFSEGPELLVLDEPTDHLDFGGRAALERILREWQGGLVVVSHDAEFLAAIRVQARLELVGRVTKDTSYIMPDWPAGGSTPLDCSARCLARNPATEIR